jgi:hypothetical protein
VAARLSGGAGPDLDGRGARLMRAMT